MKRFKDFTDNISHTIYTTMADQRQEQESDEERQSTEDQSEQYQDTEYEYIYDTGGEEDEEEWQRLEQQRQAIRPPVIDEPTSIEEHGELPPINNPIPWEQLVYTPPTPPTVETEHPRTFREMESQSKRPRIMNEPRNTGREPDSPIAPERIEFKQVATPPPAIEEPGYEFPAQEPGWDTEEYKYSEEIDVTQEMWGRDRRFLNQRAILDSGATHNQANHTQINRDYLRTRRLAEPYLTRFGNSQLERIYAGFRDGHYTWHALSTGMQPLMSVAQIVDTGHSVTFDPMRVTIRDIKNRYYLSIARPRRRDRMYIVPFRVLKFLTHAKQEHSPEMARVLLERAKQEFDSTERIRYDPRLAAANNSIKESGETNSAKLVINPANRTAMVQDLHERMGHASEGTMCQALDHDPPLWRNTGITSKEVRRAFRKRPCVWCALCKRNDEPPITTREKKVRFVDQQQDTNREEAHTYGEGECISADDNGPVTPAGMLGELYWLLFKDIATGKRWVTYSKTAITSEVFMEEFNNVRRYFEAKEKPIKILRTDFAKQFISPATQRELLRQGIASQNSAPYRHFQNSVERDVQTIIKKASTILHGQLWLRPDAWALAVRHTVELDNYLPRSGGRSSPNYVLEGATLDARYDYKFPFGQLVCCNIPKQLRDWKFDTREDLLVYVLEAQGVKEGAWVYSPFDRNVRCRGGLAALRIDDTQFIDWFIKKSIKNEKATPLKTIKDAVTNFMGIATLKIDINGIIHEVPKEPLSVPLLTPNQITALNRRPAKEPVRMDTELRTRSLMETLDSITEQMQDLQVNTAPIVKADTGSSQEKDTKDTNDNKTQEDNYEEESDREQSDYYKYMKDPIADPDEEITLNTILNYPPDKRKLWENEIRREITSLLETSGALEEVTEEWMIRNRGDFDVIGMKIVYKEKQKADGSFDKLKCRASLRGDMLTKILIILGFKPPAIYSPTISMLTFMTILALSVIFCFFRATMDVISAYLQIAYPQDGRKILTRLDPRVCKILGLDPKKRYLVKKYVYGLPDAGRRFYLGFTKLLAEKGYTM
jgi:hypothetical protein